MDEELIAYMKRRYNLMIGERTAEQIKIEIGSAYPSDGDGPCEMEIKGRGPYIRYSENHNHKRG